MIPELLLEAIRELHEQTMTIYGEVSKLMDIAEYELARNPRVLSLVKTKLRELREEATVLENKIWDLEQRLD